MDRLESIEAIKQLAFRYALAVDSRDFDGIADCFIPDVRVGANAIGREALKEYYRVGLERFRGSAHLVANQLIDLTGPDRATAVVYCRAEHEVDSGMVVLFLQYVDQCERAEGEWYYRRRRPLYWYSELTTAQLGPRKVVPPGSGRPQDPDLPGWWPTWPGSTHAAKTKGDSLNRRRSGFLSGLVPEQYSDL